MTLMPFNLLKLCTDLTLNITQKQHILLGITSGVCALHTAGIAHCDIKLENILLDSNYQPKVADFGLAGSKRGAGTKSYMAPEHWIEQIPFDSIKADAWSFGILCFMLLENRKPFTDE